MHNFKYVAFVQEAKEIRKARTSVHDDGPGLVDILLDNDSKPPPQVMQLTQQALKQQVRGQMALAYHSAWDIYVTLLIISVNVFSLNF